MGTRGKWNVLLLAVVVVAACAPMGIDYERRLEKIEQRVDALERVRPEDLLLLPSLAPTVTHAETQDKNRNGVHDAYDGINLVPLGPYPVGRRPLHIAAGQIDTPDARVGLAVTNSNDSSVTLLRQLVDKSFVTETTILGIGAAPTCIAIGDLDGDGDMDFAVGHGAEQFLTVIKAIRPPELKVVRYRSETHPLSRDPALARAPVCVLIGDFDGGGLDVVTTSGAGGADEEHTKMRDVRAITLFSNGVFAEPQHRTRVQLIPAALTAADFDGDGDLDVCVADAVGISHVVCFFNGGSGVSGWTQWRFRTGLTHSKVIAAGDLNRDGRMDLAVAGEEGVVVLLNSGREPSLGDARCQSEHRSEGPGCFGQRFTRSDVFGSAKGASGIAIADIDGDGDQDVAVTVSSTNEVVVLRNVGGRGRLGWEVRLPVGDGPSGIVASDLDADGRMDLAVAHSRSNDVWVLHRVRAR